MSPSNKSIVSSDRSTTISISFGEAFNKQIYEMFGTYTETQAKKVVNQADQETLEDTQDATISSKQLFVPGSMKDVICMHASWGVDFE